MDFSVRSWEKIDDVGSGDCDRVVLAGVDFGFSITKHRQLVAKKVIKLNQ